MFKLQELIGSFSNMVFDGTNVWLHSDNADSCARGSYNYAENQVDIVKYYRCSDGLPDDKNFRLNFYNGSMPKTVFSALVFASPFLRSEGLLVCPQILNTSLRPYTA